LTARAARRPDAAALIRPHRTRSRAALAVRGGTVVG